MAERVSSNDPSWLDSRRLSEAGIRRTSDNSVILTEDTDSFIIGDRVWVGGIKPGQIAFIGETQFAPGEWAGIVLDEPVGKNDGSVSGIRYFQCENKRGVFSRLGRLTRQPLLSQTPSPVQTNTPFSKTPPLSLNKLPSSPAGLPLKTPVPPTQANIPGKDVKVGERVIVMSREGSKAGILRYKGLTSFAPGQWCGVELDDPLGKNDGSVNGVRYFTCEQKYGLFAPIHKVSRSPATGRRPSCQLHHGTLQQYGSRESLNSAASVNTNTSSKKMFPRSFTTPLGFAKSSNQAAIREKDEEIDQLLKERELQRSRMTKAAEQADEAEKKLKLFQLQFDTFRNDAEKKIDNLQTCIRKLEEEKVDILAQLEDVQFRAEEETIIKSDIEVLNNDNVKRIAELETLLLAEKSNCEKLLQNVSKLEESEKTITELKDKVEHLEKTEELAKLKISKAEEQMGNEIINLSKLKDNLALNLEENKKEIQNLNDKVEDLSLKLNCKDEEIEDYTKKFKSKNEVIDNYELICRNMKEKLTQLESEKNYLENNYSEIQGRHNELLEADKSFKRNVEQHQKTAEESLTTLDKKYSLAVEKFNNCFEKLTITEESLRLSTLKNEEYERNILSLTKEFDDLKVNSVETLSNIQINNKKELTDLSNKCSSIEREFDLYKKYSHFLIENIEKKTKEIIVVLGALIESKKDNIKADTLIPFKTKLSNLINEIKMHEKKAENWNEEGVANIEEENFNPLIEDNENDSQIQMELNALEIEELKQKLQKIEGSYSELLLIKEKLENEVSELTTKNSDFSDRLSDLNERLIDYQKQIEKLNANAEISKTFENTEQELLKQLNDCNREIENLRRTLESTEGKNSELNLFKKQMESEIEELKRKTSEYYVQLTHLKEKLVDKQNKIDELNLGKSEVSSKFEVKEHQLLVNIKELQQEKEEFKQKFQIIEEERSNLLSLNEKLEYKVAELSLKNKEYSNSITDVNGRLVEYKNQIEKLNICISNKTNDFEDKNQNLLQQIHALTEMKQKIKNDYDQQCQLINEYTEATGRHKSDIEDLNAQLIKETEKNNEYRALQTILNEKFIHFESLCGENLGDYSFQTPVESATNKLNVKGRILEMNANDEINLLTKENNELKFFNKPNVDFKKEVATVRNMIKDISPNKGFSVEIKKEIDKKLDEIDYKFAPMVEKTDRQMVFEIRDQNLVQADEINANIIKNNLAETGSGIDKVQSDGNEMKFYQLKTNAKAVSDAITDQISHLKNRHKSINNMKFQYESNCKHLQGLIDEFILLKKELQAVHGSKTNHCSKLHNKKEELPPKRECTCVKNGLSSKKVDYNVNESQETYQRSFWLEEKELAESQINFLNSIIVDLQNKNTTLLARIDTLERYGGNDDVEKKSKKKVSRAPRLFCDICDIFDAHETEDCPKQGNDISPPPTPKKNENRKHITRPYCEVCEVFGHDTQDCDDAQTF